MQDNIIKIAVVGLPNVGKTTFLNTLTGANLKTANFAGSTTNKHEIAFLHKNKTFVFIDLPGFNSTLNLENELSKESVNFLKNEKYDIILHIVNAEFSYFSKILQNELEQITSKKILTAINFPSLKFKQEDVSKNFVNPILFSAKSKENCMQIIDIIIQNKIKSYNLLTKEFKYDITKISNVIDKIALSKIFGVPVFFGIMFFIFWFSFIVGQEIGDFIVEEGIERFSIFLMELEFIPQFLKTLIKSVLVGVGTFVGLIPILVICTSLITLIEQTGYITRIAFLMNKLFEKFNLGGKSIIPLILGGGCSITGYMSARMISDPKEKLLTMVIIGFIPCTAKLAVFMLFCVALFGDYAPLAISIIYISGFIIGLICAKILGVFFKASHVKTKIEIFNYRLPDFKNILKTGFSRTMDYIKNAATFITIVATLLSLLSLIGYTQGAFILLSEHEIDSSILGFIGQSLTTFFSPMDLDYKMIISLISGIMAKETAIATLGILYGTTEEGLNLVIQNIIGMKQAIVYLVFMFFYLPCISATASFYREVKSLKITIFLVVFTIGLAYSASTLINIILK